METIVNNYIKMFSYGDTMDWMTKIKTPGELPQN